MTWYEYIFSTVLWVPGAHKTKNLQQRIAQGTTVLLKILVKKSVIRKRAKVVWGKRIGGSS